jgi:aminopeptidase N
VRRLRAAQFPEDGGPLAHPVRPDSYLAIDNFYTATIYQKGAEVVRMLHTMLGSAGFRRGMDTYIARHDNAAVTIEDFVNALQDGGGVDLSAFMAWYGQAGTPELSTEENYDAATQRYTLTLRQSTRPTPGQPDKKPLPIPVAMGLLAPDGAELTTRLLLLTGTEQKFEFEKIHAPPVPSLLRGYSAPVKLVGVPPERLRFLAAHDTDPFVRWDSGQQYATGVMLDMIAGRRKLALDTGLEAALSATLAGADADPAFAAEALSLPSEAFVGDQMATVDVDGIFEIRSFLRAEIGRRLAPALHETYQRLDDPDEYRIDGNSIGRRALRNACLAYLAAAGGDGVALARAQFDAISNMTDVLAALMALAVTDAPDRTAALAAFHARWRGDDLVLDKWFAIQATSPRPQTLEEVRALYRHPDFDLRNPNRVRALVGAFCSGNQVRFHDPSGAGYCFLAETVIALDPTNGQVAARIVDPLGTWRRHDSGRAALMRGQLEKILGQPKLSRLTFEKVSKALAV